MTREAQLEKYIWGLIDAWPMKDAACTACGKERPAIYFEVQQWLQGAGRKVSQCVRCGRSFLGHECTHCEP